MLKALLLLLMNLALAVMATAQNLVPNGSFEDTTSCELPTQCTLLKASHWYNPNTATPDLYDCDLDRGCGSPMDPDIGTAYQPSFDGLRHAGAFFWYGSGGGNTRDYMMTRLSGAMESGGSYRVELSYSRRRFYHQLAIDHIGVWFGMDSLFEPQPDRLDVTAQVRLRDADSSYLAVGGEWAMLADTFVAQGGEQWMVIGNFDVAGSVDGIVAEPTGIQLSCYYFIDAVSVTPLEPTGIADQGLAVYWNGSAIAILSQGSRDIDRVVLYSASGQLLYQRLGRLTGPWIEWTLPELADGLYLLVAETRSGRLARKFIKGEGGR